MIQQEKVIAAYLWDKWHPTTCARIGCWRCQIARFIFWLVTAKWMEPDQMELEAAEAARVT